MPKVIAITPAEMPTRKPTGKRETARLEYDRLVALYAPGSLLRVELSDDENKPYVRKQIAQAFERRGLSIEFTRAPRGVSDVIYGTVSGGSEQQPLPLEPADDDTPDDQETPAGVETEPTAPPVPAVAVSAQNGHTRPGKRARANTRA